VGFGGLRCQNIAPHVSWACGLTGESGAVASHQIIWPEGKLINGEIPLPPPVSGHYTFDCPLMDEKGKPYKFERSVFGKGDDGEEDMEVGLRYLTPVPWLKMRFKHPKFPLISPSTGHLIVDANLEILDKRTMASSTHQNPKVSGTMHINTSVFSTAVC